MKLSHVKPSHVAVNAEAITPSALRQNGLENIKYILWDFGGTLAEHSAKELEDDVVAALRALERAGFRQYIHSNAYGSNVDKLRRIVQHYGLKMDVVTPIVVTPDGENPKLYAKPRPLMIEKIMVDNNVQADEILVVGDQMLKDVWAANNAGAFSVLVSRRGSEDDWRIKYLQRPLEMMLAKFFKIPQQSKQLTKVD